MIDCPQPQPDCTPGWASLGTGAQPAGTWPLLTTTILAATGYELPPEACDIVDGSLHAYLGPILDPSEWQQLPWTLIADDLCLPRDGSGFVLFSVDVTWHLYSLEYVTASDDPYSRPLGSVGAFACAAVGFGTPYGSVCFWEPVAPGLFLWPHDLDGSGSIDVGDLLEVLDGWGSPWDVRDLLEVLSVWGATSPWS